MLTEFENEENRVGEGEDSDRLVTLSSSPHFLNLERSKHLADASHSCPHKQPALICCCTIQEAGTGVFNSPVRTNMLQVWTEISPLVAKCLISLTVRGLVHTSAEEERSVDIGVKRQGGDHFACIPTIPQKRRVL